MPSALGEGKLVVAHVIVYIHIPKATAQTPDDVGPSVAAPTVEEAGCYDSFTGQPSTTPVADPARPWAILPPIEPVYSFDDVSGARTLFPPLGMSEASAAKAVLVREHEASLRRTTGQTGGWWRSHVFKWPVEKKERNWWRSHVFKWPVEKKERNWWRWAKEGKGGGGCGEEEGNRRWDRWRGRWWGREEVKPVVEVESEEGKWVGGEMEKERRAAMESFQNRGMSEPLLESKKPPSEASEEARAKLEEILCDTTLSWWVRFRKAIGIELKYLFRLAGPAIIVYVLNSVISMSTQIFCGHVGNLELAASSLGNNGIQLLAYGLMGFTSILIKVLVQQFDVNLVFQTAARNGKCSRNFVRAGIRRTEVRDARSIYAEIDSPANGHRASPDDRIHILQAAPAPARRIPTGGLCVRAVRIRPDTANLRVRCQFPYTEVLAGAKHCECQCVYISRDAGVAHLFDMAGVVCVRMGTAGAALVLSFSWWIIVVAQFVYILTSERCKATWSGFSWMAFTGLWDFFKLSAASAVMLCLETWYFQILVLIAGLLPDPEIALDSLAVCVTIVGWAITISTGFNAAVSVRVSNELGAKHPKSAAFSVVLSTGTSFIISVIFAFITLVLRHQLSYAFTPGEVVSGAVADLTPLLAASIILNGIQPVLSGVAVGCGWQALVAYVNVGCYYMIGVPVGVVLGFTFNLGAKVVRARNRIEKWNDQKEEFQVK
ncbi:protein DETOXIFICATION 40 [Sesamum angolense]|uniref:Protein DETOXIFICATION n=1 Tax=Sesamum angolense TaxID=2727404 RepID=A0AAE1WRD2_9LAMI|nr:protein DETOXIFICATION 40 [Sesamum angolense]